MSLKVNEIGGELLSLHHDFCLLRHSLVANTETGLCGDHQGDGSARFCSSGSKKEPQLFKLPYSEFLFMFVLLLT